MAKMIEKIGMTCLNGSDKMVLIVTGAMMVSSGHAKWQRRMVLIVASPMVASIGENSQVFRRF